MQNISRSNKWRLPLLCVSGPKIGILGTNLFGTKQVRFWQYVQYYIITGLTRLENDGLIA